MTATPAQIPKITPQFSRSHFSTLVTQPCRRDRDRVGGPCAGGRRMALWSQADIKRAFTKHSLLSLDWVSEGKNNRAWLSRGNVESGVSGARSPNSRTIGLSFYSQQNHAVQTRRAFPPSPGGKWVWWNHKVWNSNLRLAQVRDADGSRWRSGSHAPFRRRGDQWTGAHTGPPAWCLSRAGTRCGRSTGRGSGSCSWWWGCQTSFQAQSTHSTSSDADLGENDRWQS